MDKAAVYELEKKSKCSLFGRYYYDWPSGSASEDNGHTNCFGNDEKDEMEFELEKMQELHMFNR